MFNNTITAIFNYLKNGFYSPYDYEITLKIYLIYIFSTISLIIFFVLGVQSILNDNLSLGLILIIGAGLFIFNILYLKVSKNYTVSALIIIYFLFMLMLYLIIYGGISNTGPLWSFVLPLIVMFIHGFKRGLTELIIYMLVIFTLLFLKDGFFLETSYEYAFKVRLIIVLMVIIFLSSIYQYTREISMKRMLQLQTDLEFFLRRDPLTGLYNRRGYDYHIPNIEEASYGAILMCDIDHFKKINDTHGHSAGDLVLQTVANILKEGIRTQDISVRWGGEEFFIFLSMVTGDEAYHIAEKLRQKIENTPIDYYKKSIDITMSIGIAIVKEDILLQDAIKSADIAMYLAKSRGRNQTTKP